MKHNPGRDALNPVGMISFDTISVFINSLPKSPFIAQTLQVEGMSKDDELADKRVVSEFFVHPEFSTCNLNLLVSHCCHR